MVKRKKDARKAQYPLDTYSQKRGRGRPGVRKSEIEGRASRYRLIFEQIWEPCGEALLRATTQAEVIHAFEKAGIYYVNELGHLAPLFLKVRGERRFPKRREAQINFIADSLAALGRVSPRRSRDICEEMRAILKKKTQYKILRREYYIECSCKYKGPAQNDACPKCGAEIARSFGGIYGFGFN